MSSLASHHPDDAILLRYIDGELPRRKTRQVKRHLEACWQCRSEVEGLQTTVADCVRYRRQALEKHLPAPPQPWQDLYREFDRIDAEMAEQSWAVRLGRFFQPASLRWSLAAASAIALLAVVYLQVRETPAVQAATLLQKAVAADRSPAERRFLVRTSSGESQNHMRPALRARLAAAHFDAANPFGARAFQAWRDTLQSRHDEVKTVSDPLAPNQNCFQIRTSTDDGALEEARLVLSAVDLRPIRETLAFRNREWIEMTELTEATTRDDGRPVATNVEPPVRLTVPSRSAASPSGPTASISDELQVLLALHGIGADLGDPVEVTRSGGRVLVSGMGLTAERRQQIRRALQSLPSVEIQWAEPSAAPAQSDQPAPDLATGGPAPSAIQARVEKLAGGKVEFQKLSTQVLDGNDALMSRAYALRSLAQRFPADVEASLGENDRRILNGMVREHAAAMARDVAALQSILNPVLHGLGGEASGRSISAGTWQAAAEDAFRDSQRAETLSSVLLGMAPVDGSTDGLPSNLLSGLGELHRLLVSTQFTGRQ